MNSIAKAGLAALTVTFVAACQNDITAPSIGRNLRGASPAIVANDDGSYFVGKGDVQTLYGWNNQRMQANAPFVDFQISSSEITTWTCTRTWTTGPAHNQTVHEVVQNRQNSTTIQGLFTTQGRENSQGLNGPNTGFIVTPDGEPTIVTDGPAVGSCPAQPSGFVYDGNVSVQSNGGGGLQIIVRSPAPGTFLTPTGMNKDVWYNIQ